MQAIGPADLSGFLAVVRHMSFRKAADELGVTPSALSHNLRGLEERLQVRLLNRTTRSVALTEAGERLVARLAPAFRDINDALEDLALLHGKPQGLLRINAARVSAQMVLLPLVTKFLGAYPDVRVEIAVDDRLIDMVSEGFDAGVRFGETLAQDMIALAIGPRQRTAIIASPAFFQRHEKPATPQQLRALPCIRFRFGSGRFYAWEFERGGVELKVEVDGPLILGDQGLMIEAALDGLGLAYAFEDQVKDLIVDGKLVRVLEDWCPYYEGFHLYYPSRRQMPSALKAFVDFVKAG